MSELQLKVCKMCGETSTNFNKYKKNKDGLHSYCKPCQSKVARKSYEKNKSKVKERGKLRRRAIKKNNLRIVKELFKLECSFCGLRHHTLAPYDFHHIDPTEKEGLISDYMRLVDEDKLRRELSKCILLCACCHRIEHERLREEERKKNEFNKITKSV